MKFAVVLIAIFSVSLGSALPSTRGGLNEDLQEFIALLPKDQIIAIALDYLANDAEVQGAFEFIMSDDFKKVLYDIEGIKEYQEFLKYLQNNGLNVYYYLKRLHELLEMDPFEPAPSKKTSRRGVGVRGLLDDIEAILPIDKIKELYYHKLETSAAFRNLLYIMKGEDFKGIVKQLMANPGFQAVIDKLKSQGVDMKLVVDLLNKIFGWGIVGTH